MGSELTASQGNLRWREPQVALHQVNGLVVNPIGGIDRGVVRADLGDFHTQVRARTRPPDPLGDDRLSHLGVLAQQRPDLRLESRRRVLGRRSFVVRGLDDGTAFATVFRDISNL
ncbi:hypothetical protein [Ferrimicrobium acidiphilum]|uniref:hypothetical protein n=1 Tax=Ferrimicrobium acidiphilum TaxID=121039 RepID=UPI0023F0973D|nr:hypothetical protein [Ferrimicrobium acidiphilum]